MFSRIDGADKALSATIRLLAQTVFWTNGRGYPAINQDTAAQDRKAHRQHYPGSIYAPGPPNLGIFFARRTVISM